MITSGDDTTFLISLITLIIAAFTFGFTGLNFLKMREPFMTLDIAAKTVMSSGLPRGIDPGVLILSYRNATTNNNLNDFSIKGTICRGNGNVMVNISNLPTHVQLAPAQKHEVQIEVQKLLEQNGVILDMPEVYVYIYFDCSYNRFGIIKKEQHFKYKWDRKLAPENQWTIC